ncbi:MAG: preprotein translocase subunit SecE [Acholeplasmatales bacterium]|jgi:preprotein translocase subunit SecE|nr:preprotein translocase subunit SecE [Acholeplasmatales bacterium]
MAIKAKEKKEKSKLLEVLTKEYRWENLILAVLVIAAIILSSLILTNTLTIDPNFPVLGQGVAGKVFAWVLLGIAIIGLLLVLYPFLLPAVPELKKVSWPKGLVYLDLAIRVFVFTILLTAILFLFDKAATEIFKWIKTWGD